MQTIAAVSAMASTARHRPRGVTAATVSFFFFAIPILSPASAAAVDAPGPAAHSPGHDTDYYMDREPLMGAFLMVGGVIVFIGGIAWIARVADKKRTAAMEVVA